MFEKQTETELAKEIGDKVSGQREKTGHTLDVLARKTGLSKEAIHRIERGTTLPTVKSLKKIADYLKTKVRNLLP